MKHSCRSLSDLGRGRLLFLNMSRETQTAVTASEPTPEAVAQLLDVVADHSVEVALFDMEQMLARLRSDAEEAAEARAVLRGTPAKVLREALRLRAARTEAVQ